MRRSHAMRIDGASVGPSSAQTRAANLGRDLDVIAEDLDVPRLAAPPADVYEVGQQLGGGVALRRFSGLGGVCPSRGLTAIVSRFVAQTGHVGSVH